MVLFSSRWELEKPRLFAQQLIKFASMHHDKGPGAKVAKILSAGVVILHHHRDRHQYLLLRAYNYWDFPKGVVESGETPLEAAIREVREETGLEELHFNWGHVYRETNPYNQGRKIARYYIAESPKNLVYLPVNPLLGRPEHNDYRWATRAEAWRLLTPRVRAILDWADKVINDITLPAPDSASE